MRTPLWKFGLYTDNCREEREQEVKSKLAALKIQLDLVADYGRLLSEESLRQQGTDLNYSKLNPLYWLPQHHRSSVMSKAPITNLSHLPIPLRYAKNENFSFEVARGRLKKALTEFYRSLEYLKTYKVRYLIVYLKDILTWA